MTHPILTNESDSVAATEISESVRGLTKLLGVPIRYFAYPNGGSALDYGTREERILRDAGVALALSTDIGCFNRRTSPYGVPRLQFAEMARERPFKMITRLLLVPFGERLRNKTELRQREVILQTSFAKAMRARN